jgi:4-hydroxy-2-oxoheptanedioate aldolase
MVEVIQRIAKAAKANAIMAGIQCGSESYAAKAIDWGYSMVTLTNDVRLLATGARQSVSNMHALLGRGKVDADTNAKGGY